MDGESEIVLDISKPSLKILMAACFGLCNTSCKSKHSTAPELMLHCDMGLCLVKIHIFHLFCPQNVFLNAVYNYFRFVYISKSCLQDLFIYLSFMFLFFLNQFVLELLYLSFPGTAIRYLPTFLHLIQLNKNHENPHASFALPPCSPRFYKGVTKGEWTWMLEVL